MHVVFVDTNAVGKNALRTARRSNHDVTFVCSRRFAAFIGGPAAVAGDEFTNRILEIETSNDEDELFAALASLHGERPIDAVITVLDFCALPVARCARRLGLVGTDPEALALAQNKAACRRRIDQSGLLSVPYAVVDGPAGARDAANTIGFPVIAKPNRGAASIFAARINDETELDAYFAARAERPAVPQGVMDALSDAILIERYIEGPLFSVEIAAAEGRVVPLILSARKRCAENPSVELGTTMPAPVQPATATALISYAVEVVESLGLDVGIFHIEMILGPQGPVLVEANPRIMGGNMPTIFRLATDVDPYDLLIDIHLSGRIPDACLTVTGKRAASTRMIGPLKTATVAPTLAANWTEPFLRHAAAWQFDAGPGTLLRRMDTSFCPHAFQVVRDSPVETSLLAEWIVAMMERTSGVPMRRSSEDCLLV